MKKINHHCKTCANYGFGCEGLETDSLENEVLEVLSMGPARDIPDCHEFETEE